MYRFEGMLVAGVKSAKNRMLFETQLPGECSLSLTGYPDGIRQRTKEIRRGQCPDSLFQRAKPKAVGGHHAPTTSGEFLRYASVCRHMPAAEHKNVRCELTQSLMQRCEFCLRSPCQTIGEPSELTRIKRRIFVMDAMAYKKLNSFTPGQFLQARIHISR